MHNTLTLMNKHNATFKSIKYKSKLKLDSLRWFPDVVAKRHIFGGAHSGDTWVCTPKLPPNSNSAEIFVQCTYPPQSFIIVRKLSC